MCRKQLLLQKIEANELKTDEFIQAVESWNTGMSQDKYRTQIVDERFRELCFEGWRRIDLLLTDIKLVKVKNRVQ